jgi:repressor LexA
MTRHRKDRPDEIVRVIAEFTSEYGYPPSIRDIMVRVDLASTSAVHHHLHKLAREGRIEFEPKISRSLRVIPQPTGEGICARPGCGKRLSIFHTNPKTRWCSRSCAAIAAHVRRWLRASGAEYLADQLGRPA